MAKTALVAPAGVSAFNGRNGTVYTVDSSGICQFNPNDVLDALNAGWQYPQIAGTATAKMNLAATTDPGVSNDNTQDYGPGSVWLNTTKNRGWLCIAAATGAAIWANLNVDSTLLPAADGLTAAGSTQATALALTAAINKITTTATNTGVALPASKDGLDVIIVNQGANPLTVYPFNASGDTIDGLAANAGVTIMPNSTVLFVCTAAGAWTTEGLATGYAGSNLQTVSSVDGLVAHAGGGQGSATALTAMLNRVVTVATAADSVGLPVSKAGMTITVVNAAAANSMNVFPASGEQINALGANAAFAVVAGKTATFVCITAGQWHALLSA